jgi:hypothetical protein
MFFSSLTCLDRLEDGHVMINTAEGRVKHKNILQDNRVTLSVVSKTDPCNMTSIKGIVEIIPDYEYSHINRLTKNI